MEEQERKIDSIPEDILKSKIIEYFAKQQQVLPKASPFTLPSLALHLSVPLKELIFYPESGKYYNMIAHTKLKCENDLIERMIDKRIDKATGQLFLKNHFGYVDIAKGQEDAAAKKRRKDAMNRSRSISDILDEVEAADNLK